jgi:hypothetical protein
MKVNIKKQHLNTFNISQIEQIREWVGKFLPDQLNVLEDKETLIVTEILNGKSYLKSLNCSGKIFKPI